jgi:hypothetical protein
MKEIGFDVRSQAPAPLPPLIDAPRRTQTQEAASAPTVPARPTKATHAPPAPPAAKPKGAK